MTGAPFTATIEGYASIFNVPDQNGDIVAPGAFRACLQTRQPVRMLYQHMAETPIGRWLSAREDARGLWVSGEITLGSDKAREVYALLEAGAIDGLSIGFQTVKARKEGAGRRILKADLWEVSIVTFPMARAARIINIGPPKPMKTFMAAQTANDDASLFAGAMRGAAQILSA